MIDFTNDSNSVSPEPPSSRFCPERYDRPHSIPLQKRSCLQNARYSRLEGGEGAVDESELGEGTDGLDWRDRRSGSGSGSGSDDGRGGGWWKWMWRRFMPEMKLGFWRSHDVMQYNDI